LADEVNRHSCEGDGDGIDAHPSSFGSHFAMFELMTGGARRQTARASPIGKAVVKSGNAGRNKSAGTSG